MNSIKKSRNSKKVIIYILLLVISLSSLLLILYNSNNKHSLKIQKGTLNLSSWDFEKDGYIKLNGNWDFYWDNILFYEDFKTNTNSSILGKVPRVWNNFILNGNHLTGLGKATYRLHVNNAVAGEELSVIFESISTAYRAYVNNELIASCGRLSDTGEFKAQYQSVSANFIVPNSEFDIIIQVENNVYARGGIWQALYLGNASKMDRLVTLKVYKDLFIFGSLFVFMVMFLIMLFFVKHQRYSLYLFISDFLIFIRNSFHASYAIYTIFPNIPFKLMVRTDYLSLILIPLFMVMFIKSFVGDQFKIKRDIFVILFFLVVSIFTYSISFTILTNMVLYYELFFFLLGLYGVFRIYREWKQNLTGSRIITIGLAILLLLTFIDALYQASIIDSLLGEYFSVGYVFTSFCLISVILQKYNDYIKTELNFLKAQIRPHFIHNALNTILIISRTDPDRSRTLLINFSNYLRSCYDFETITELIPLEKELDYVRSYAEIEKARFGNKLNVEYQICNPKIKIPFLTLQPLVENAIIHGIREKEDGGMVTVYAETREKYIRIGVRDNGVGFSNKKAHHLGGSSIGMDNINERLKKICNSKLVVENMVDGGSNVYFDLKEQPK